MTSSKLLCLLAIITVTACAPVQVTYLRPSAPGAEYARSTCGGAAGPKDRAVLRGPGGFVIRVESYYLERVSSINLWKEKISAKQGTTVYHASHIYPKGIGITISVEAQQDQAALIRLLSNSFILTDEATGAIHEYQPEHVWLFEDPGVLLNGPDAAALVIRYGDPRVQVDRSHIPTWPKWAQSAGSILQSPPPELRRLGALQALPPIPPTMKGLNKVHRPYYIILFFENVQSTQFRLRIPPVSVDAAPFNFPEIIFRLVNEQIIEPLNC